MGCDIHLHIEIKVNGKWEHYAAPRVGRWYQLFSKMAGVRGNEKPIVGARGFPDDASVITRLMYDFDGSDAHTSSWLDCYEINILRDWLRNQPTDKPMGNDLEFSILSGTYYFGNCFSLNARTPATVSDFRFVFWFDN